MDETTAVRLLHPLRRKERKEKTRQREFPSISRGANQAVRGGGTCLLGEKLRAAPHPVSEVA